MGISPEDLDDEETMRKVIASECRSWSQEHDAILTEWLDLRARVAGTHPLNLKRQDVTSPDSVISNLIASQKLKFYSPDVLASFAERFGTLSIHHSELGIQLRAMMLIHFNDLLLPLLPIVFESSEVDHDGVDSMSLSFLISSFKNCIFSEVHPKQSLLYPY